MGGWCSYCQEDDKYRFTGDDKQPGAMRPEGKEGKEGSNKGSNKNQHRYKRQVSDSYDHEGN